MHLSTGMSSCSKISRPLEAVTHQVAALDDELLPLRTLLLGELGVVVLERQPAERDVPRLVLHDVREQLLDQRVGRQIPVEPERRERQSLDEDLHAEIGQIPAGVLK